MLIEIAETHPAAPGKKMASVVATGGQRYGVWPEMLADFRIGGKFQVEVESWQSNGRTLQKIVKATPASAAANGHGATQAASNGAARTNGHSHAPAVPAGEAEFVGRALAAFILKGEVTLHMQRITDTTLMLREVWRMTGRAASGGGHA